MEPATTTEQKTLYDRLGRAEGIATIVDDVVDAHMQNPVLSPRFLPYKDQSEKLAIVKGHFCAFLGAGSGGPETYTGRDMVTAHKGMNISESEYMAALDDIIMVLDRHEIDEQTKKDMLYIAFSLKKDIVHV